MASNFNKAHEYPHEKRPGTGQSPYTPQEVPQVATEVLPPSRDDDVPDKPVEKFTHKNSQLKLRTLYWALRYFSVVIIVAALLIIPIAITRNDGIIQDEEQEKRGTASNLVFYIFLWLEITWVAGVLADLFAMMLPYIYRLLARSGTRYPFWRQATYLHGVSRYFNPAHQKYWRLFRVLRRPIRFLGTLAFAYIGFTVVSIR
jgi:hypothetical protein